jgi:hypothetical protein
MEVNVLIKAGQALSSAYSFESGWRKNHQRLCAEGLSRSNKNEPAHASQE